jgi:predicted alpha-1,2-mannosidase
MQLFRINLLILASSALLCVGSSVGSQGVAQGTSRPVTGKAALQYANPLVGTAPLDNPAVIGNAPPPGEQLYSGFVPPGPLLPHGPYEATPVNVNLAVQYPAGVSWPYYYPNPTLFGFSAGGPGGPLLVPVVGDWTPPPAQPPSTYKKSSEHASPGYYSVDLDTFGIHAELTATLDTSLYRFTFPATDKAHLLLSLDSVSGHVEIMNDHTLRGVIDPGPDRRQDGAPSGAYFVAEFSRPFTSSGTFRQVLPDKPAPDNILGYSDVQPQGHSVDGASAGAYLDLHTTSGEQVLVKIAHGYSYEQAEARLHAEQPGWDFEGIRRQAEAAWADRLGRIEVEGGTEHQRAVFYSTLLHSYTSPRLLARKGESFVGLDNQQHVATHDFYGPVPFWDTGRNQVTLLTLLEPKVMQDILQSQLDMARESGYMGTSFHGDNAVFMYLGAWKSGIPFDHAGVYEYLRKNATDPAGPRHYLAEYMKQGWISDIIPPFNPNPPYAGGKAGAATTLEYAWDDYALSQYAEKLGRNSDAAMFLKRAYNYRNVFDPAVGFMRGRTTNGGWACPSAGPDKGTFNPQEPYYNFMMKEGSGWSTLWLVPQDVAGLVHLLGGRDKAAAKLDAFFSTPYTPAGICRDCTGLIGQYVQGNQPDQQAAYYYDWMGQPWKTQQLVRRILRDMYGSDRDGLAYPGMDDQGSTSSWYVMSAMGFYPVDPSSADYILGSPIFDRVTMNIGNGKTFAIVARNNSATNLYIQSATLNGKPWNKPWFSHADIDEGGTLVLTMGSTPNKQWGSELQGAPPSMSKMD